MKRFILILTVVLLLSSCAQMAPVDEVSYEAQVEADFEKVMSSIGTEDAAKVFAEYDAKYGTTLTQDFADQILKSKMSGKKDSDYAPLTDLFFNKDGAVYLSGGGEGLVSSVIGWVAPKSFDGNYFHGAVLDLNKYNPLDQSKACLQTAITKGAGYESATDWRKNVNVCVMNPKTSLNQAKLDKAQKAMDYYCDPDNTDMQYGFFEGYVNIFNIVQKDDPYYWYCTKVVWKVYKDYGIDIDSNSTALNFKNSGLYSLISAFYKAKYFYSSSKANKAINDYVESTRKEIVLAEEIMVSPYLTKVYEKIRGE